MEKIINGKKYNTETAEEIASDRYGNVGDFNRYWKEVYRTKKGNWFLYESGGANSKMSVEVGSNNYSGSEDITELTEKEAKEELEKMGNVVEVEKYFQIEEA